MQDSITRLFLEQQIGTSKFDTIKITSLYNLYCCYKSTLRVGTTIHRYLQEGQHDDVGKQQKLSERRVDQDIPRFELDESDQQPRERNRVLAQCLSNETVL